MNELPASARRGDSNRMIAAWVRLSEVWARRSMRFDPDQQIGQFEAQGRYRSVRGEPIEQGAKPN